MILKANVHEYGYVDLLKYLLPSLSAVIVNLISCASLSTLNSLGSMHKLPDEAPLHNELIN